MSLVKPYESAAIANKWRMRKFIADYGVYIALLALLLAATVLTPKLYDVNTIAVVMRQASQLGIVAIGQTMILLGRRSRPVHRRHIPHDLDRSGGRHQWAR